MMIWVEALAPLNSDQEKNQVRHAIRNFGLWLTAFVVADLVIGIAFLKIPDHLHQISFGLFYWLPLPSSVLLIIAGILVIDVFSYLFHRLLHQIPWLWQIHSVHHSDIELDVTTSIRNHPFDLVLGNLWKAVGCLLFGIPLWIIALREIIFLPFILLQHANIRVPDRLEYILSLAVISPAIHKHHHSIIRAEHDSNYGTGLVIWDKLFRTFQQPRLPIPKELGVRGLQEEKWQSIMGMLLTPFRYKPEKITAIPKPDGV